VDNVLEVSSPRGSFVLKSGEQPVVLLSAGIGATPVLAMLHALAADRSTRQVLWIHAARDREHHAFASEVRNLMLTLPHGRSYVCYSRPAAGDKGVAIAMLPVICRDQLSTRSTCHARRMSTCAGQVASRRT